MATYEWPTKPEITEINSEPSKKAQPPGFEVLPSEEYAVKAMPPILGTFDLTAIYVSIIFFITNVNTAVGLGGGPATFTYWILVGATFFIPCAIATAQLGVMFPLEGSLYNWTHKAFGGYWSFFVAFCAWFPGVLLMTSASGVVVSYIQGVSNGAWLQLPWQQGVALVGLTIFSGILATQRFRTIQNVDNIIVCFIFVAVLLVGIAGVAWLVKPGHHSVTPFNHIADWSPFNPATFALFGITAQAYLGIEVPLNMGGEIVRGERGRSAIIKHLLWGTLIVMAFYLIVTFSTLAVQGATNGGAQYSLAQTVTAGLNSAFGNIVSICIMSAFVIVPVVYNYSYARLLLVAGIDQRLPRNLGKLNKHRVPANAIIFQTVIAVIFTAIAYLVIPYIGNLGDPANLSTVVYNVVLAASTLVWAISTGFLQVNLAKFYFMDRRAFRNRLIVPMPIIWFSIVVGIASCLLAIIGTLIFSWIPQNISNNQWWYIIGGTTVVCLIIAAIGSMLASSEADWQELNR